MRIAYIYTSKRERDANFEEAFLSWRDEKNYEKKILTIAGDILIFYIATEDKFDLDLLENRRFDQIRFINHQTQEMTDYILRRVKQK